MKRSAIVMILTIAVALTSLPAAIAAPGLTPGTKAVVNSISSPGTADAGYKTGAKWRPLKKDKTIGADGTMVKTGPDTTVELQLGQLMTVTVEPGTELRLENFYFTRWDDQASLWMKAGALTVSAKKGIGHQALVVVRTDKFRASTGNGRFRVSVAGDAHTVEALQRSAVTQEDATGVSHLIKQGKALVVDAQGSRIVDQSQPRPWWRMLIWLALIPIALLARRLMSKPQPGRRVRRTRSEST